MKEQQALLFLKKKKQKNFCYSGPWACHQHAPKETKIFCALFFKKAPLAL